jgi:hypothetical protein
MNVPMKRPAMKRRGSEASSNDAMQDVRHSRRWSRSDSTLLGDIKKLAIKLDPPSDKTAASILFRSPPKGMTVDDRHHHAGTRRVRFASAQLANPDPAICAIASRAAGSTVSMNRRAMTLQQRGYYGDRQDRVLSASVDGVVPHGDEIATRLDSWMDDSRCKRHLIR